MGKFPSTDQTRMGNWEQAKIKDTDEPVDLIAAYSSCTFLS